MSTKAQLQAASDDNITDAALIIPSAHRAANNAMIGEIYAATPTANTQAGVGSVLTPAGANFNYSLMFVKQGRVVYVTGILRNASGGSLSAQNIASGLSGGLTPVVDQYYNTVNSGGRLELSFDSDGNLKLVATLSTNSDFAINAHYFVAN